MDFKYWKSRRREAQYGKISYTYRGYTLTIDGYQLSPDSFTREEFVEHRQVTNKVYDMGTNIKIRPLVSDPTIGMFEYSTTVRNETIDEVDEAALDDFCKYYGITDKEALTDLYSFSEHNLIEALQALSQLPDLLKKFQ